MWKSSFWQFCLKNHQLAITSKLSLSGIFTHVSVWTTQVNTTWCKSTGSLDFDLCIDQLCIYEAEVFFLINFFILFQIFHCSQFLHENPVRFKHIRQKFFTAHSTQRKHFYNNKRVGTLCEAQNKHAQLKRVCMWTVTSYVIGWESEQKITTFKNCGQIIQKFHGFGKPLKILGEWSLLCRCK